VRAYTASAAEGLKHSEIITRFHGFKLRIASDYTSLGKIQHLLAQRDICILESVYTDKVELVVLVPDEEEGALYKEIMDGTNGQADLEKEQECWFAQTEDGMKIFEE
jgi:putative IMPACT (imprinted ancient) family translation regulator